VHARHGVWPWIEATPGVGQVGNLGLGETQDCVLREKFVELAAEQDVATHIRRFAGADAGDTPDIAFAAPLVGHRRPVGGDALGPADGLQVTDNRPAPVDARAEDVKDKGFYRVDGHELSVPIVSSRRRQVFSPKGLLSEGSFLRGGLLSEGSCLRGQVFSEGRSSPIEGSSRKEVFSEKGFFSERGFLAEGARFCRRETSFEEKTTFGEKPLSARGLLAGVRTDVL